MGLTEDLELRISEQRPGQRLVTRVARTRLGSAVLRRILEPLDRSWARLTGGRSSAIGVLAGLPVIDLGTTGARSGLQRSSLLTPIPFEGDIAVLGTFFGGNRTPGWVHNLEADPSATITYEGTTVAVTARRADPAETDRIFEAATAIYRGYADYRERAGAREIRAFVLTAIG